MFVIIGAGMAGLVAGCVFDQQRKLDSILERSSNLPNNHTALLRFKSSIVGDTVGIPFRPVDVVKSVHTQASTPVASAIAYSVKTTGIAALRSVLSAEGKKEKRFISPDDFISEMGDRFLGTGKIAFDINVDAKKLSDCAWNGKKVVSTMPMHRLAKMLNYEGFQKSEFRSAKGWTMRVKLKRTNLCATIYFPDKEQKYYRASITDNTLIVEYANPMDDILFQAHMEKFIGRPKMQKDELLEVLDAFGLDFEYVEGKPAFGESRYAKILPIDEDERRRFIMWATDQHGIYSLGRFATWRPGLLTDDLIQDIRLIEKMSNKTDYEKRK